jgi:predicted acylesterase/phospholipase RssA
MATTSSKCFLTLSFSGAGHLLPYHLGAAKVLLAHANELPHIRAVSGSSSGAMAACVMALMPHRLEEYSNRFLEDRGHAFRNLETMLQEEESVTITTTTTSGGLQLGISTTKCSDGSMHLFSFDSASASRDKILQTVQASCQIPTSFHPIDVFSSMPLQYGDGVAIDSILYADGGIAAPAPPTSLDHVLGAIPLRISPISGSGINRISPKDTSFSLPVTLTARCGTFQIRPSIQNLRSLLGAVGAMNPETLHSWYQRGQEDTGVFLEQQQHSWNAS